MAKKEKDVVSQTFHAMVESADRKFGRVRDLPLYGRAQQNHYFQKVFKAYMRLWKYQQENRSKLVDSGLNRWEIGEIASRIGQLYFNQYMRSSEARFLVEAYVFYEAILERKYFDARGSGKPKVDVGVRFKELRFYARFLLVALIFNKVDMVRLLAERFKGLVDDSMTNFRETNFKEWKLVVQEIFRFMEVGTVFTNVRPLRYCALFDSHPASRPYLARFHARKIVKFRDALLTSYHRKEVKFAELTLDTYRMMQCLEWEPSGSFYQRRPVESVYQKHPVESNENGTVIDHSGAVSGLIDINLAADLTDPTLPPNPRKAVLYRPSVTRLLAVMATICEELPPETIMLIYLSASGNAAHSNLSQAGSSGGSRKSSKDKVVSGVYGEDKSSAPESHCNGKRESSDYYDNYLWLGPRGYGGSNALYPGDIIPFTRRPLFLIIDSDSSHAFKVLHGAERGEPAALLLSPLKPAFKNLSAVDTSHCGSQFTFFLTAPLPAFCQMVGLTSADSDMDFYNDAEEILSIAFSEWEVILCTSKGLDLVWAQVLSDPFLRRLILRFIFCRSVLSFFCPLEDEQYLPICLPHLPNSVSARSEVVQSAVFRLANHLKVADCFQFDDT
ncbi:PREDICTED: protein SCAI homolog isoform X1 [Populus euphratica]|uniref:Protein SCAI homolog isoform X1 n=1 Tax=Populus euphratica TaxID=75702 RepID=A0AAJ6XBW7_POPEU|nr:PREDICTED: protein SCAI homolog isoform X1 [Populus euphratica]